MKYTLHQVSLSKKLPERGLGLDGWFDGVYVAVTWWFPGTIRRKWNHEKLNNIAKNEVQYWFD